MTRTLAIALISSFAAGGAAVWWTRGPAPAGPTETRSAGAVERSAARRPAARAESGSERDPMTSAERELSPVSEAFRRRVEAEDPRSDERSVLLREWARTDPSGFLDALPTLDPGTSSRLADSNGPAYLDALRLASEADPRYALAVGERQAGTLALWIRATALEALAAEDADAALDYLDGIEAGDLRDRLLASAAAGFARKDPNAAIAWLATLDDADGSAFYPVIDAVALVDLPRAIELDARAIELDYGGLDYGDITWLTNGLEARPQNPARIADILASMGAKGLLGEALAWWGQTDAYGAIAWIQSQETISALVIGRVAGTLAERDFRNAMALGDQFSPAVRAAWVEAVIGSAAAFDLPGAVEALEPYRGDAAFEDVLWRIVTTANRTTGPSSAAAIAGASPPPAWVANSIANDWSELDPRAAASWALSLEDETARASALRSALVSWFRRDPEAAGNFVRGIADESLRSQIEPYLCSGRQACANRF
jgi:hypothetical protein